MSDVLPSTGYEIQIKQRSGKWVLWCYALESDWAEKWRYMPAIRRTARLLQLPDKTVLSRYDPPALVTQ